MRVQRSPITAETVAAAARSFVAQWEATPMATSAPPRRLKFWGWGYEDQQPRADEVRAAGAGIRAHLGFEPDEAEPPPRIEDVELPPPRVEPPPSLAASCGRRARPRRALLRPLLPRHRAGLPRPFDHPPDLVARPRDEAELERVLAWCEQERLAAIPFGGGTSVVGGVEPDVGEGFAGAVSVDLKRLDRVLEVDAVSRAALIEAGATGPSLEDQLRDARPHAAPLPAVLRVLHAGRLDRHPRRRPLRHAAHPHRRPRRVGPRHHAARRVGVAPAARLGRGAEPGPACCWARRACSASSRGRGCACRSGRTSGHRPACASTASSRAPGPCASCRSRASGRRTAGCSIPTRPMLTGAGADGKALLVLGLRVGRPRAGRLARPRLRELRRPRRPLVGETTEGDARRGRGRRAGTWRNAFMRRALPARRAGRGWADRRDVRDGDHLGPLRRFAPRVREAAAAALRGPAAADA